MGLQDRDYYQKAIDEKAGAVPVTKKPFRPIMARDPFVNSGRPVVKPGRPVAKSEARNWIAVFGWTISICAAVFIIVRWAINHVSFH